MTLSLVVILFIGARVPEAEILIVLNMMTPFLATIIMLFVVMRDGYTENSPSSVGRSGWRSWALTLLLPLPVPAVSYGLAC